MKKPGVTVDYVSPNSTCNIDVGDVVDEIRGVYIASETDFQNSMRNVRKGESITGVVNFAPFRCTPAEDRTLGFTVKEETPRSLNFGIDIEGGSRIVLAPVETNVTKEQITDTVKTIENRINFYGLREVKVSTLGSNLIQIEMSGGTGDDIRDFVSKQGRFEGELAQNIRYANNKSVVRVGNRTYNVELVGTQVRYDGDLYSVNETMLIGGETFRVISAGNGTSLLYADLFSGDDIVNVFTDAQNGGIRPTGQNEYEFSFGVQITKESAERFAKLTQGHLPSRSSSRDTYIEPRLILLLDGVPITELNIGSSLAGQAVTTATISGSESTLDAAVKERLRLVSTLRGGQLPLKLEIVKVDTITQTAGKELINSTIFVAIASIIAVGAIVSYRYRDYRLVIPMILISVAEIVIVIGMAASQAFAALVIIVAVLMGLIKREVTGIVGWATLAVMVLAASTVTITPWTIDIPVVAGLIAILGTGVNQMIIMSDQLFREKGKGLQERHKSAMHIIWSSAAIVVFAMVPLILGGIGSLKGFAIATIIGVLVGILVTRPAYVAIIEKVKKVQLDSV